MKLYTKIKILKTKGAKKKQIKKYKDQNQLSMQTLKVRPSFVVFSTSVPYLSTSVPYLSTMSLLNKSGSIDLQFDQFIFHNRKPCTRISNLIPKSSSLTCNKPCMLKAETRSFKDYSGKSPVYLSQEVFPPLFFLLYWDLNPEILSISNRL